MNPTLEALTLNQAPIVTFGYIMQVFFSLLVVLGIIYLSAKYVLPRLQVKRKGSIIELEDRIGLEPQVSAYIIRAENKRWLIMVSNKNVTVVDKLEEV